MAEMSKKSYGKLRAADDDLLKPFKTLLIHLPAAVHFLVYCYIILFFFNVKNRIICFLVKNITVTPLD